MRTVLALANDHRSSEKFAVYNLSFLKDVVVFVVGRGVDGQKVEDGVEDVVLFEDGREISLVGPEAF